MKLVKYVAVASLAAVMLSSTVSCGNRKVNDQKKIEIDQRTMIEKQIEENVYPLPTSAEVVRMLTDLDVGYIIGISNPSEYASRYLTSRSRAVNLGVYGADLSYATLYNMQQEVINYLNSIRILANELNMSQIYDEKLYNDIKTNFDNRDRLVAILTSAFNDTYNFLSENDQQSLAILMVGGAWVEGMYITTHISESVYHVEGIVRVLLEQKKSFDLFLEVAKPYSDDQMVADFIRTLEPVRKVYEGLSTSLTLENVKDITKAIEEVRTSLVN